VKERDPKDRKRITKLDLGEISLVDRPSNPDAVLEIFKAAGIIAGAKPKPTVSRESVDTLMAAMSPESRAAVITQAVQHLRLRANPSFLRY
jgi:hypothetical protein